MSAGAAAVIHVAPGTFLAIVTASALAGTLAGVVDGAVGEFGPILLLTLILSAQSPLHNALILVAFVALAVGVALSRCDRVRPVRAVLLHRQRHGA